MNDRALVPPALLFALAALAACGDASAPGHADDGRSADALPLVDGGPGDQRPGDAERPGDSGREPASPTDAALATDAAPASDATPAPDATAFDDAAPPADGGACPRPAIELPCNDADDDCDGRVDEDVVAAAPIAPDGRRTTFAGDHRLETISYAVGFGPVEGGADLWLVEGTADCGWGLRLTRWSGADPDGAPRDLLTACGRTEGAPVHHGEAAVGERLLACSVGHAPAYDLRCGQSTTDPAAFAHATRLGVANNQVAVLPRADGGWRVAWTPRDVEADEDGRGALRLTDLGPDLIVGGERDAPGPALRVWSAVQAGGGDWYLGDGQHDDQPSLLAWRDGDLAPRVLPGAGCGARATVAQVAARGGDRLEWVASTDAGLTFGWLEDGIPRAVRLGEPAFAVAFARIGPVRHVFALDADRAALSTWRLTAEGVVLEGPTELATSEAPRGLELGGAATDADDTLWLVWRRRIGGNSLQTHLTTLRVE